MAAEWYKKAADQGHALARYDLGVLYDQGNGVRQDYTVAAAWYRKSADQGLAEAQYNLAGQYAKGQGVPSDPIRAYKWVSLAVLNAKTPNVRDMAAKTRDGIVSLMTKAQIAEAEKQVKAWKPVLSKSIKDSAELEGSK